MDTFATAALIIFFFMRDACSPYKKSKKMTEEK